MRFPPMNAYRMPADPDVWEQIRAIPMEIPGVRIYADTGALWPTLLPDNASDEDRQGVTQLWIRAPIHAAWLVEDWLEACGLPVEPRAMESAAEHTSPLLPTVGVNPGDWQRRPAASAKSDPQTAAIGWAVTDALVQRGLVKPVARDALLYHQLVGVGLAATHPSLLFVWPAGRGKTLGSLVAALTRPGPVLAVVLNAVRGSWREQAARWTELDVFETKPHASRKDADHLATFLAQRDARAPGPLVLAHMESVAIHLNELLASRLNPATLILDEVQKMAATSWWTPTPTADGEGVTFEMKRTASGESDRIIRNGAIYQLSVQPSLRLRIGLSASPLHNGRPRRLFAPLTFLSSRDKGPGEWGRYRTAFAQRYCNGGVNGAGYFKDDGATNLDELRARLSFWMHEVTLEETHEGAPPVRLEFIWLTEDQLAPPSGKLASAMRAWKKAAVKGAALGKAARAILDEDTDAEIEGPAAAGGVWLGLAEACARKTPEAVRMAAQAFRSGQKIVLFTALRSDCERLAHAVETALRKPVADVGSAVREGRGREDEPTGTFLRFAHGGHSNEARESARVWFRDHAGPCVLVGTGHAWGTGVDGLQTADLAIILMTTFEIGDLVVQWRGRFDRYGGGSRPTRVCVLLGRGTADEDLMDALAEQVGNIQNVLNADEFDGVLPGLQGHRNLDDVRDAVVQTLAQRLFSSMNIF